MPATVTHANHCHHTNYCTNETNYVTVLHVNDLITHSIPRSVWHGWGDPSEAKPLSDAAWRQLAEEIGADRKQSSPPVDLQDVLLPESRLSGAAGAALADAAAAASAKPAPKRAPKAAPAE
jgi:hypothetical protein